jgi:hypothetical protein
LKPLENLENPFQGNQEAQEGQLESRDDALRPSGYPLKWVFKGFKSFVVFLMGPSCPNWDK